MKLDFDSMLEKFLRKSIDFIKKEKAYDFYKTIFNEIMKEENVSLDDIKFSSGYNSSVAIIGNKVIKSGVKITHKVPYHKRILQPIIRTPIELINESRVKYIRKQYFSFFEVYEKVDTTNITEEEVYEVFKEMLYDNILWADPRVDNLGRLLKPNRAYIYDNNESYYVDDESVGIIGEEQKTVLDKGEVVIMDVDLIYKVNTDNLVDVIKQMVEDDPNIDPSVLMINLSMKYNLDKNHDYATGRYLYEYIRKFIDELKINNNKGGIK